MRIHFLLFLLISSIVSSATPPAQAWESGNRRTSPFTFHFVQETCEASGTKKNIVVSPYGAYAILSLLTNGASGVTKAELLKTLSASDVAALNSEIESSCDSLSANEEHLKLAVANAIFADKDFPILDSFKKIATNFYAAKTDSINFEKPEAVATINGWVSDHTKGCIAKIIDDLKKRDCLVLINAVYFKGQWLTTFERSMTKPEPFHLLNGSTKDEPMMHRAGNVAYATTENFDAIELPYVESKQSLFILLPHTGQTPQDLLKGLDPKSWTKLENEMRTENVRMSIPKFHVESNIELNEPLQKMGIVSAFSPRSASFKSLSSEPVYASRALQKTYMDVDEEGTEAAAVTAIVMAKAMAVLQRRTIDFRVDRPFLVVLEDKPSNQILFVGVIVDP